MRQKHTKYRVKFLKLQRLLETKDCFAEGQKTKDKGQVTSEISKEDLKAPLNSKDDVLDYLFNCRRHQIP